ncbi:MAG: DUF981 family protein [Candidatus Micrarchaeota archaeon]|nr:DUF981 family protein [Candidatus Micrarchaeota archaeon]
MAFIDNLAYQLLTLSFACFMLLYTVTSMYLIYRKKGKNFREHLKSASVPIAMLGTYMIVTGLWGQFTWPLPGSYNILFYDPFISFGIILLAFSLTVKYEVRFEYLGFLGLMIGVMTILYGVEGYKIGLTKEPVALLAMYFLYGLAGIFSYPVSLIADKITLPRIYARVWMGWIIMLVLFWLFLFAAGSLSASVGIAAISQHLISAP